MDPARIQTLADPALYPEHPGEVEIVQTHLSVVVLAGGAAYKFKKAVHLPFADFSTLEKRRVACEDEVALNRRLCPSVYEGVVAWTPQGVEPVAPGGGPPLDYAVKMRRLPQDRMMDELLARDAVRADEVEAIARRVVEFHRKARRGPEVDAWGDPGRLRAFALANFEETRGLFPADLHRILGERTGRDFDALLPLLRDRLVRGCVVDGHGDLHARNICLEDPPAIYDCIEFEPAFRCGDVATEHAFLAMDLRFRGHPELADRYLAAVVEASGDRELPDLVPALVRYRAMVRAKVSAIAAAEPELGDAARLDAASTARRYLRLAAASAAEGGDPLWILCCGLPAAGKSVAATALAEASGSAWPVLSSDRVRKELAGVRPTDPLPASYYAAEFSRRTYDELLARAEAVSAPGRVLLVDANFRSREDRLRFAAAARAAGARSAILQVQLDDTASLERLRARSAAGNSESDADAKVYESLRETFEPPGEGEADRLLRLPGELAVEEAADRVLAELLA
jgi:aminoglycoside phosphotransferase family enzyme/predicted kinase